MCASSYLAYTVAVSVIERVAMFTCVFEVAVVTGLS